MPGRPSWLLVSLLALLVGPLLAPPAAASSPRGIVVLPGALVPSLSGVRVDAIAAYAAGPGGAPVAIPFQIDERDPRGRYVVDRALDGSAADLPRDDGRFDANDEAVFEAGDAGARLAAAAWPAHRNAAEIEITDPASGEKRFVYLLEVSAPPRPRRADVRYVAEGSGRVDARNYTLEFGMLPTTVSALRITKAAGGTDVNLVKRSHYKAYSRLSPYLLSLRINRDDDDVVATVLGYRQGPVRVIRLVRRYTNLVLGLATPEHVRTEFYSASQAEWREEVGYSLDMERLVARSVVETWFEFTREADGADFYCQGCSGPEGRIEPGGESPALGKARWWGMHGPAGSFYARYAMEGEGEQSLLLDAGKGGRAAGGSTCSP